MTELVSDRSTFRTTYTKNGLGENEKRTYWDFFQPFISNNETHSERSINTKCPFLNCNLSLRRKKKKKKIEKKKLCKPIGQFYIN